MKGHGRFSLFSLVFGVAYTLGYYSGWALFRYYPLIRQFHMDSQPRRSGPAMLWYGWMFDAAAIALLVAFLIPRAWSDRLPGSLVWIMSLALILVMFTYERHWFFQS